jgi:lysozyme family protein
MFPLVAIATSILPDLIKLIAGDKTGTVATDVANAVQKVTGTTDPTTAKQKLDSDPAASANLQIQLAQIALAAAKAQSDELDRQRQSELDDLKQRLGDVQSARTNLLDLAKDEGSIAWIPPAVSFLVMIGFYILLGMLIAMKLDLQTNGQLINICIGALVAAFSTVVNFWLGSSKGSQDKEKVQAAQTTAILNQQSQQTAAAHDTANAAIEKAATATATAAAAAVSKGAPASKAQTTPKTDAATNFTDCLDVVFREEGGYTNDPNDPGGPTNFGITIEDLKEWRGHDVTAEDVKTMIKTEAQEIYRSKYWNPMQCGEMPNGIDLEVFDFGVNAGIRTSIRTVQEVVGVTADGSVGPITLGAIKAANPRTVIQTFSQRRLDYYRSCAEWSHFGAGWTNRTNSVEQTALNMEGQPTATQVA